jgi:DNA-binding transcriptional MocR family regulator
MNAARPAKPLPVYLQIAELLARQIKAGYWHGGERLPTEAELALSLSVAVGTLRKSLALLEEQGVLERIQALMCAKCKASSKFMSCFAWNCLMALACQRRIFWMCPSRLARSAFLPSPAWVHFAGAYAGFVF